MLTQAPHTVEAGATERIDVIACLDERNRRRASEPQAAEPGRYLEVQGAGETLLIPLGRDVIHIGRGLSADLHLDEGSVSRRHAILVSRSSGARILDDRSANGTLVNGRRVTQADLSSGDVIVLGRVVLRYLELPRDDLGVTGARLDRSQPDAARRAGEHRSQRRRPRPVEGLGG